MNPPFRALGLTHDETRSVLTAAGQAPSVHNTQPWRFRLTPDTIELHADPARRLPVADPDGTELRISCGAALLNLRIALDALGIRATVSVQPDRRRPDLIAEIRHRGRQPPLPETLRLRRAIPGRHTNRRPFADTPVAPPARHALRRAALEEGAWLHVVSDRDARAELAHLASQAHRVQLADELFCRELAEWTGIDNTRRDGVPAAAGGPAPEPNDLWVHRDFSAGRNTMRMAEKAYEEEPLLAILSAHSTGPAGDVAAGQALERLLLVATDNGLSVSFLSQLVEVGHVREKVRRLVSGTRSPQVVLRVGHGWPVGPTPRRRIEELLVTEPHDPAPDTPVRRPAPDGSPQ